MRNHILVAVAASAVAFGLLKPTDAGQGAQLAQFEQLLRDKGIIDQTGTYVSSSGSTSLSDGSNVVLGTSTGSKFGTSTSQKLGFYNATPSAQPAGSTDVLASLVALGLRAASSNPPLNLGSGAISADNSTFTGTVALAGATISGSPTWSNSQAITLSSLAFSGNGASDVGAASVGLKRIYVDYTNTATVGNVTVNKSSGRVNLAAGGTVFTVTNSNVTAASHVFLNPDGAPGNLVAVLFYAVPAAGSFTINAVPAVTNQTAIDFFVANAD